jgi:hypothetical protein
MHGFIDAIDVAAQVGERKILLARLFWHGQARRTA